MLEQKNRKRPNRILINSDLEKLVLESAKIAFEDYVDGRMALEAESNGMLSAEETKEVLDKYRMLD